VRAAARDPRHRDGNARAARSLLRASTHAALRRCYRYRAPGCRAPFVCTHTRARPWAALLCPLPSAYTPAPGTNIIACRDKFIADVPQPARKRSALTEENGSHARGRRRRGAEGVRIDPAGARVRGIYPAAGITRYTRCPGDDFRAPPFPPGRMSRAERNRPRREIVSRERRRGNARRMRPRSPSEKESARERDRENNKSDGNSFPVRATPAAICLPMAAEGGQITRRERMEGANWQGPRKFPSLLPLPDNFLEIRKSFTTSRNILIFPR